MDVWRRGLLGESGEMLEASARGPCGSTSCVEAQNIRMALENFCNRKEQCDMHLRHSLVAYTTLLSVRSYSYQVGPIRVTHAFIVSRDDAPRKSFVFLRPYIVHYRTGEAMGEKEQYRERDRSYSTITPRCKTFVRGQASAQVGIFSFHGAT